ncbi:MAG: HD domain-containing protein [Bacillota bacterium]
MNKTVSQLKETYQELFKKSRRPGVTEFLKWLEGTDFYTAPCSTKYHLAREGGLVEHSINVLYALLDNLKRLGLQNITFESSIIVALGHDICKADFYDQEMRNVKRDGSWVQEPFYTVKDKFPYGHGEKSVLLLQRFIKLTPEEALAIRWHMGGFTPGLSDYSMKQAFSEAAKATPLVVLLHMADLEATYIREVQSE